MDTPDINTILASVQQRRAEIEAELASKLPLEQELAKIVLVERALSGEPEPKRRGRPPRNAVA